MTLAVRCPRCDRQRTGTKAQVERVLANGYCEYDVPEVHEVADPECTQHSRGERENEFARCEVCRPLDLCSSCGGSLDSPPCLRNPVTGKGGHSRPGGWAASQGVDAREPHPSGSQRPRAEGAE